MVDWCAKFSECTVQAWWWIAKKHFAFPFKWIFHLLLSRPCSCLYLILHCLKASPLLVGFANFISMSCCWSVSQRLKSVMQNQNNPWVVATGRYVARLKNKKSFFSFPLTQKRFPVRMRTMQAFFTSWTTALCSTSVQFLLTLWI